MPVFVASRAWLGGDDLAADVVIDVEGERFRDVRDAATGAPSDAVRLDGIVIPGLVDAHSHCFHRGLRGATWEDDDFWGWRQQMYRLAARLDPGAYRRVAEAVFVEKLAAGITTVGEFHYLHHRPDGSGYDDPHAMAMALVEASESSGVRLTVIDSCYLTSDVDGSPPGPVQVRFSDGSVGAWRRRTTELADRLRHHHRVRQAVAVHSVRAAPPAAIETVAATAAELGIPLHVHVSEQPTENQACLRVHGVTPVALLDRCGALGPNTTLVHATHLTDDDVSVVASSGARVCLCPTTERDLGDGVGPAAELASAGVPLCLGCDSNAVVDLLEEARAVEMDDRLRLRRRGVHDPVELLAAATSEGAAALDWEVGRIAPGAAADLVVLDSHHPTLAGVPPTPAALVAAAGAAAVHRVMVGGRFADAATPRDGTVFEEIRS